MEGRRKKGQAKARRLVSRWNMYVVVWEGEVDRVWGRGSGVNDSSASGRTVGWLGAESLDKRASGGAIALARLRALSIA